jgi:xanthine dehydrogenase accessory factor
MMPEISLVDYSPLLAAGRWHDLGMRTALATIVAIDGKSPRTVGAQMAVSESGLVQGYLTGGCLEAELALRSQQAIRDGSNLLERYGKGSRYFDLRLPCGSGIDIYFDQTFDGDLFQNAAAAIRERRPFSIQTDLRQGRSVFSRHPRSLRQQAMEAGQFERLYLPSVRTVIFGSGQASVQLTGLVKYLGIPAELKATDNPTLDLARANGLDASMLKSGTDVPDIDSWTACVLMFHEHTLEQPLLEHLLHSDAFYIGAVGSKSVNEERLARLVERGFQQPDLARIVAPAGSVRRARTATEMAVGLLSEILDTARRKGLVT